MTGEVQEVDSESGSGDGSQQGAGPSVHLLILLTSWGFFSVMFVFWFLVGLGFEFRALHLQNSALLLEPLLQSILFWLFWT
jgi:hypothetical protein